MVFCRSDMESQDARGNTVRIDQSRARCEDLGRVCPAKPNRVRPTRDPYLDRSSDILGAWQTRSKSRRRANARCAGPAIRSSRLCRLPGLRLARADAQAAHRRSRVERRAVSSQVEPTTGSPDHGPRLSRASLHDGQAAWTRSIWLGIENNGGTGNPDTAKATGATTNAKKLIGHGGIGSLTMTEAGADSLLIYAFTAMMAHLLMSLGQTLFHRYLGHSRLGGRFFKNHIQFHHVHYAGDHVISTHYLDNGDNNTLLFLTPVVLIVGLSYLFLRFDFIVVQFAAMSLSFCEHYYLDNQYHVAGSWLGRFSWFRRKQQLHFIHHRHGNCNFAVIDFFWDRLLSTYRRVESAGCPVTSASPRPRPTAT
jgi:hypothetical protein